VPHTKLTQSLLGYKSIESNSGSSFFTASTKPSSNTAVRTILIMLHSITVQRCPSTGHSRPLLSCLNKPGSPPDCLPEHTLLTGCSAGQNLHLQGTWRAHPTSTPNGFSEVIAHSDLPSSQPHLPSEESTSSIMPTDLFQQTIPAQTSALVDTAVSETEPCSQLTLVYTMASLSVGSAAAL